MLMGCLLGVDFLRKYGCKIDFCPKKEREREREHLLGIEEPSRFAEQHNLLLA